MGKTELVTGATGRMGSLLCRELWKMDYNEKAFVLPGDPFVNRLVYGSSDAVYPPFCHSSDP